MRIGMVLQQTSEMRWPPFDGPANHTRAVFRALTDLGHHVRLVACSARQFWATDDLVSFESIRIPADERRPRRWFERSVRRLQSSLRLPYANLFDSRRFAEACCQALADRDLLFERVSWMGWGGGWAARRLHLPLVGEYNGDPLLDLEAHGRAPQGVQRRLSVFLARRALRRLDHVVASGEGWRRQFIRAWGFDPARVTAVENGTSLVRLLSRESLRSFDGVAARSPVRAVYLGGFQPWQGVPQLLRALRRTRDAVDIELWLLGDGPGLREARQLAHQLDLGSSVVFTGPLTVEEFAPLLAGADIGVSPYCGWSEYSGLKLMEYKAAGLAIVASGEGDQPRTLRHGDTGWVVPPCDEQALTAALVELATNGPLRIRLGRKARLEAEHVHGWDETGRKLTEVFESVRMTSFGNRGARR